MAEKIGRHCLNGMIMTCSIYRSARNMKSDTMLVRASDILQQFDVAQVPMMENDECQAFIGYVNEKQT